MTGKNSFFLDKKNFIITRFSISIKTFPHLSTLFFSTVTFPLLFGNGFNNKVETSTTYPNLFLGQVSQNNADFFYNSHHELNYLNIDFINKKICVIIEILWEKFIRTNSPTSSAAQRQYVYMLFPSLLDPLQFVEYNLP